MRRHHYAFAIAATVLASLPSAFAAHYEIDSSHSSMGFRIRHLVSKVTGKFNSFKGTFEYDPKELKNWKSEASIETASIDTGNGKRDEHLRSKDFFDAKKNPAIIFTSKKISDIKDNTAKLEGELTMHGITKPVVLDLEMGGAAKDPWGNQRAGFTAKGKVNRKDFGLNWNKALESGGVLVGDDVELTIEVEGVAKEEAHKEGAKK